MKAHQTAMSLATFRASAGPFFILCLLVGGLWSGTATHAASPKQMETWRGDPSFHPELTEQDRESLICNLELWSGGKEIRLADTLPSSQINHLYLPAVRSQETQNCVTFAMCYYYRTWQEAREHGWVHPDPDLNPGQVMNPQFVSRLGALTGMLKILGCASFEAMENGWDTEQNLPLESCYDDARLHRARSFYTLPEDDTLAMAALKQHLVDGDLAHVSLLNSDNFSSYHGGTGDGYENDVFFAYRGSSGIGHALTVIGYDDDKAYNADGEARQGAFLLVNGWGQDWGWTLPEIGTAGFIWIGYDFFTEKMLNNIVLMEDRPSVDDTNFAYVRLEHDRIPELNWQLIGGSPQFPTGAYSLGSLFGLGSRDGFFKFGIDDLVGGVDGGGAVRMQVYDMDLGNAFGDSNSYTGVIKAFWASQDGVAADWVAERNLPVSTMDANVSDFKDIAEKTLTWDLRVVEEEYVETFNLISLLPKQLFCADFDGDGDVDLLGRFPWLLKVNDGSGNFSQVDLSLGIKMFVQDIADFNNDGLLDLLLLDQDRTEFLIYYGTREAARFVDSGIRFAAPNGPLHAEVVDFNGDGLPDVSTREKPDYSNPPKPTTFRVWLNSGDGAFADSGLRLPFVDFSRWGFAAWGDYDNDGLPDLALAAGVFQTTTKPRVYILQNNGDGTLAEAGSFEFTVEGEGLRWADMTGDGLLDLIVTDRDGLVILRNAGDGVFEEMTRNLQGIKNVVSLAVGDADNDGLADLAVQGIRTDEVINETVQTRDHTGLFFNRGNGPFVWATGPSEILLQDTAVALGDFDADGDLDMCAYGNHDEGTSDFPGGIVPNTRLEFFKNLAANERLNRPNAPPMAPVVTWAGYDPLQHTVTIKWRANADDHTPGPQLGWRVRLGTRPGRGDLIGAAFNLERPVQVHPLPDGSGVCTLSYNNFDLNQATYVSVQAVDEGLASSPWSGAYELLPADASSIYDVNGDGLIDVADLLRLQKILNDDKVDPDPRADLSGDSVVTLLDRTMMIDCLIARLSFDSTVMDLIPVGPTASIVKYDRLELDFPSALNNQGQTVVLMPSNADAPYDNLLAETFYRLDDMPAQRDAPITVRMFAPGADPQTTRLLFGQQVTPTSIWEPIKSWLAIAPDSSSGDWLTFTIPASLQSNLRLKTQTVKATEQAWVRQASYSLEPLTNWIGLATGIIRMESDHFYVDYPAGIDALNISAMMDGLEWAYTNLKDVYGFNFTEYMNWPAKVPVNVINLRSGVFNGIKKYFSGSEVAVPYGYYDPVFDYIAINQSDVRGTATNSTHVITGIHEFCHMVIHRFRPLFSSGSGFEYNVEWLDEATAVWFESVYNNWIAPSVLDEHIAKPFKWGLLGNLAATSAESYGYGMAPLISYFTDRQVNDQFPRQLWGNLQGGKNTLASIRAASGEAGNDWWTDFMQDLATGRIYPFIWHDVEQAVGMNIIDMADFTISDMNFSRSKSFSRAHIEDLSSRLFQVKLNGDKITDDMVLSMRLEATGSQMDLTAIRFEKPASLETRAEGTLAGELIKMDLPLAGINGSNETSILPLITVPDDHIGSYCGGYDYRGLGSPTCHPRYGTASLKVAFTRDRTWNLPTPNLAHNGPYGYYTIESVVSVQGPGLADVEFINNSPDAGQMLYAQSMGVPPIDFTINVSSNFQTTEYVSGSVTYTAGPIKFYRLRYTPENFDDPEQITDSATGLLTLPQSKTSKYLLGKIYAVYDVTRTSGEETTVIYDHETIVSAVVLLP